jgi:hypothetical protein
MIDNILNFQVNGQILTVDSNEKEIVENSVGYLKAKFDFSSDWDGLYKIAVFENAKKVYAINIDKEDSIDGIFEIPYSVIKVPGFKVSCFGTKTRMTIDLSGKLVMPQTARRLTTNPLVVSLRTSGPLNGVTPPATGREISVYESSDLALRIAKEAYTVAWNMQYSLRKINELLGGDPYELFRREQRLIETLEEMTNTQIKKDQFGIPILDDNGNYIFEEK